MKDIIRMNQLAGIITEGQARKMMQVLNEGWEKTTLEDFVEAYIGGEPEEWVVSNGNVSFTIPYPEHYSSEYPAEPSEDVEKLENILRQKGIKIVDKFSDEDGGYKLDIIEVRYDDLVNSLNA